MVVLSTFFFDNNQSNFKDIFCFIVVIHLQFTQIIGGYLELQFGSQMTYIPTPYHFFQQLKNKKSGTSKSIQAEVFKANFHRLECW